MKAVTKLPRRSATRTTTSAGNAIVADASAKEKNALQLRARDTADGATACETALNGTGAGTAEKRLEAQQWERAQGLRLRTGRDRSARPMSKSGAGSEDALPMVINVR